jgi:hypothetical protein
MVDLNGEPGICAICERSMLAGERTRTYVTRDRENREVCDLCLVRAESAGWMPLELAGAAAPEGRRQGGSTVRKLLGRARESTATRLRSAPEPSRDDDAGGERAEPSTVTKPTRRRRAPRRRDAGQPAAPEAAEDEVRPRRRSVPANPERRIRRAFEAFNGSEHRATVRSLIRSLGGPFVSAVTTDDDPGNVRITVAWELSWYQYEVDLTAAGEPVRESGRGQEFAELSAEDQAWNAHAAEDGELRTGLIGSAADSS